MIYKILYRIYRTIMRSIQLQLFLTLMSSPILICWGLPISMMSPIGNIIFHPILTLFLLMSSLVFFCHILCIPCGMCIKGLEYVSNAFHYFLSFGSTSWLVGFSISYAFLLILIPILTCCILVYPKTRSLHRSIACFLVLLFVMGCGFKLVHSVPATITSIPCNKGYIILINAYNKLLLIDPGVLGQKLSTPTWVEYNLVPSIIKSTGRTSIDGVILLKPNATTIKAFNAFRLSLAVGDVYLPKLLKEQSWQVMMIDGIRVHSIGEMENIELGPDTLKLECKKSSKKFILEISGAIAGQKFKV